MRTVINDKKEITVNDLVDLLKNTNSVAFYMANSQNGNESYPVFLKQIAVNKYGFISPIFCYTHTYEGSTIRESLESALSGSKKLLVLDRNEVSQLFKKIN